MRARRWGRLLFVSSTAARTGGIVGPHYAGALIAQDLGDQGADMQRRFRFAVVTEREVVLRAARSLMLKMTSLDASDDSAQLATVVA